MTSICLGAMHRSRVNDIGGKEIAVRSKALADKESLAGRNIRESQYIITSTASARFLHRNTNPLRQDCRLQLLCL